MKRLRKWKGSRTVKKKKVRTLKLFRPRVNDTRGLRPTAPINYHRLISSIFNRAPCTLPMAVLMKKKEVTPRTIVALDRASRNEKIHVIQLGRRRVRSINNNSGGKVITVNWRARGKPEGKKGPEVRRPPRIIVLKRLAGITLQIQTC